MQSAMHRQLSSLLPKITLWVRVVRRQPAFRRHSLSIRGTRGVVAREPTCSIPAWPFCSTGAVGTLFDASRLTQTCHSFFVRSCSKVTGSGMQMDQQRVSPCPPHPLRSLWTNPLVNNACSTCAGLLALETVQCPNAESQLFGSKKLGLRMHTEL